MVQQLGADDEPLHLVAYVDRHVTMGDEGVAARAAAGLGSEESVVGGGVGDSGELPDQLLHDFVSQGGLGLRKRERGFGTLGVRERERKR